MPSSTISCARAGASPQRAADPAGSLLRPAPLAFAAARGIRTKWRSLARDQRNSIEPNLAGLELGEWMSRIEALGVNLAEINLEPENKLPVVPELSDDDLERGVAALDTPQAERSPEQAEEAAEFEHDIAPNRRYTAAQRNEVLLDFLRRLEDLRGTGAIAGSARFLIHQRLWFRPVRNRKTARKSQAHLAEFADDMGSFIRLVEDDGLGHWLAGIRLGEHSNDDMNELLPLLVGAARTVNAQTGGWLKSRLFLANGGGWGAEYRGIGRVLGLDGTPFPFFREIAAETGGFAFGYKWMQFHDEVAEDIRGHMKAAPGPGGGYDPNSVADWQAYLGDDLGLNELIAYVNANHARYPTVANVVFVGDSADAARELVEGRRRGRLAEAPALTALRALFANGNRAAFGGKVFMNGFSTAETIRDYRMGDPVDIGLSLYFVDAAGRARLLPQSRRIWEGWPGG